MLELILIDKDENFMRGVKRRFQDSAQIYLSDAQEPWRSGLKLVKEHPGAFVFIDLYIGNKHNTPLLKYVADRANDLIDDRKVAPHQLRFYSNVPSDNVPWEVREKIQQLGSKYVDKAFFVQEIEELLRETQPLPPTAAADVTTGSRRAKRTRPARLPGRLWP